MGLSTELSRKLGIEVPILLAGMGGLAGVELAAAVSNAGGLGVLGSGVTEPEVVRRRSARLRELTDRPFGFNFIIDGVDTAEDLEYVTQAVRAAAEHANVLVFFWGDPAPYVDLAHDSGALVLLQVGSVEEAQSAAACGVDAVIAQGVEAGGHVRGSASIWELLPQVISAVAPLPVLASGGIGDGAGVARALSLGAQGVSLGTRFVASEEAGTHPEYKRRVVASAASDTFYGDLFDIWWPDAPHRVLRNRLIDEWEAAGSPPPGQRPGEGTDVGTVLRASGERIPWPRYATGVVDPEFDGDLDEVPLWAGESCSFIHDVKPAATIVRELATEAEKALAGHHRR